MDPGLNERGREQVRDIVEHFPPDETYDLVTSPLRRAHESADLLARDIDVRSLEIIDEFAELDQGYWNGLRDDVLSRHDGERFEQWEQSPHETCPRGGESLDELRDRVKQGIDRVLETCQAPVIVVAHKVVNSMIVHLAEDTDYGSVMSSLPDNAAVYETSVDEDAGERL